MNAWEKYKQDREKRKQEENKQFSGSSSWAAYKANQEEQKARESRLEELRAKYGIKDGTGGAIPRPTDPELTPRLAALRAKYGIATHSKTDDDTSSRIAALREKYGLVQKAKETSLSYEELAGMTLQERLQRAALGRQEAVTKGAGNLLDALAAIGKSGDPTLPMNNATVAINAIRDNPEGVQQAMDNRAEIEAKQQAQVERAKQWASENKAGATAASVVSSPLSMVDYLQQLVEINAVGHSLPSTGLKPGEITQTLREGVSKDMGNAGKFLYNTAMSGVDSLVAGALSGGMSGVGALILGGGAASSAMNDIKQRGGTDQQAVLGGAAAGAFEAIFEKLSLGQLNALKEMPVVGAKTVVANIAKSVFTNASEEAATELANGLFDAYLMQDLSNYDLTTQEGRRDLAKQVGLSALAGGLMGGVFGGIGSVGGYLTNSQVERMIRNETTMQEMGIDTTGKTMSQLRAEVRAKLAAQEQGAETSSEESRVQTSAQEAAQTANPAASQAETSNRMNMGEVATAVLGENGAKAFRSTYNADMASRVDAESAATGFNTVYKAALDGRTMTAEEQTQTASLPAELKLAAESSARLDRQRASQAKYFGENAMLVKDDKFRKMHLSSKTVRTLDAVAKVAGVQVRFVEHVKEGRANASYGNGVIEIAMDSNDPVMTAFTHEIVHRIRETSPQSYAAMAEFVQKYLSENTGKALADRYKKTYNTADVSFYTEEMVADAFGTILQDSKAMEQFVKDDRSTAQKVLDAVQDLINAVKRALNHQNVELNRDQKTAFMALQSKLTEMENAMAKALEAVPQSAEKNTATEGGEVKLSLKRDQNGVYASIDLDQDVFEGMTTEQMQAEAKRQILSRFRGKVIGGDYTVYVTKKGAEHYAYPANRRMDVGQKQDKMRASTELDTLMAASVFRENIPDDGRHPEATGGLDKLDTRFEVNGRMYEAETTVLVTDRGRVFYDVTKFKDITKREVGQTQNRAAETSGNASGNIVAQPLNAVNPGSAEKTSLKTTDGDFSEAAKAAIKDAQLAGMMNQGRKDAEKLRRAKETTAEVRRKRDDTIRNLKEHQREQKQKASESRNASAIRGKIQRHVGDLSRKLKTPTDKKHIPENMRTAVAKLLEAINMESNYELEYGKDAKYHRAEVGTPGAEPTKRSKAFRELRLFYEKIVNGEDQTPMVVDPDLLANLNELEGLHDVRIADMSTEQLQLVWDTIRAIEMSITNVDKLFRADRYKHVSEVAQEIRDAAAHRKSKRPVRFRWGNRMLTQDMLDSLTWLHQLGEGGDTVYHILQGARDQKIAILAEVGRLTHDAIGDINVHKLEEKIHDFELSSGEHVSMTTAQIMSLYELNKRKKAQNHIYKGGIRPEPVKTGALGKEVSTPENVQVTETDVAKIVSALTAEQVRVADALQTIMQGYLADIGNEASMEVYGYKKFNEENYFPISSDPHQVQDKIGDVQENGRRRPKSVAEWGSAKATVRNANNGLMIGSIFDVFAQHAVDMSTYASHLAALEDVNRIRHFKWRDKDGTLQATMGGIIERLTGDKNQAYLNKLLQDISAGVAKNGVSGFGRITANYKAASVGLNLRVAIQQPISATWAFTVIDPKYFVICLPRRGGWKKALEWAPIAQWKDWGNFEINQGRSAKDIFFDTDTALERVRDKSMWLAGKMDSITWGAIWNACEAELRDTNKDLERGSDEFYKAVAQRFTDVIDQTQVVDNVLGRSQIMRSGDELAKMATSFLGEPTRTYNLLYRTAQDYFGEQDISRKKTAKKQLGRAVVAYTVSTFALALAQSVVDAWRDDEDRERKYLERYVDNVLPNFVSNIDLFSAIPYIKDVISILQGYEISRMDMDALTSLIQAGQNLDKTLKGEGRSSIAGAMVRLLAEAARIFGISVANLKRDMLGITQSFLVETGNWELQYELEKAMNNITVAGSRSEIYKILMSALSDGDYDAYKSIVTDMVNEGVKASTIEQGVRSAIAKYTEKHKGFSIPKEAKALLGISAAFPESTKKNDTFGPEDLGGEAYVRYSEMKADDYSAIESELRKSTRFNQLSNADKNRALDYAEKIAKEFALESASAGRYTVTTKWISRADDAQRVGISTGEYILFHMAYIDASGENKREIVREWLEKNTALNEAQREFLWSTVYDSEF